MTSPFRSDCLEGKIALVTGGGSGIGFEITKQLLLHGCAGAVICGRREQFLQKASEALTAASGKPVFYHTCDVRNADACMTVVNFVLHKFNGRLDVLVNGAAGNFLAEASSLTPKGFNTVMSIDAQGTYNMTYAAYSALRKNPKGGCVINISATLQYGATWYQCHASAAKSAVDSLTRSWALEWGNDGIRVNGIAPGPIANTPGTTKLAPSDEVDALVREHIPLNRMGQSIDIAYAAVFLCSEGGSFITGDTLVVDGAHWIHKPPLFPREIVAELSRRVEGKSRAQAPSFKSSL